MLKKLGSLFSLLLFLTCSAADARFPRGGSASGFNGGKVQTNLAVLQDGGAYPFLNAFKTAQPWGLNSGNAPVTPDLLDADGYPLATISGGGIRTVLFVPAQISRPGNYAVTWDGNGTVPLGFSQTVLPTATFTGSVTGGVLTAGAPSGGTIQKGMTLSTGGIIGDQLSGSAGQAGTYSGIGLTTAGSQSMTVSGGSTTSSGGSGRYVFSTAATLFFMGIDTVGSPRITNMKVFHVDDEAALNSGEVFSSYFKSKIRTGNIGLIRFLNWYAYQGFNVTNIAKWSQRKPASYVFYAGHEVRSGDYAGATSFNSTTKAYSTGNTPNGYALADKSWFHALIAQSYPATQISFTNGSASIGWTSHGLFVNDRVVLSQDAAGDAGTPATNFAQFVLYYVVSVPNSNTVTLSATQGGSAIVAGSAGSGIIMGNPQFTVNVNGTGAKWVLNENSTFITDSNNARPIASTYQSLATFMYDAGLDAYIKFGGDAAYGSIGLDSGVPPELIVRLAAETGAHPWLTIPPFAMDPVTDYVPELISYTKNYPGAGWMKPRFEPGNEVWNNGAAFYGTGYATAKGAANWSGGGVDDEYGKWISTLGQTVNSIYGAGLGTAYNVVLGIQTCCPGNERATASKYVAQAAAPQSLTWSGGTINYTKSAASGWASHVAPTNYVTPSEYGSGTETTRAAAFAGVRFVASISAGTMTVSQIDTAGGALAIGNTIFGRGIANGALLSGITITGGSAPTWTLSSPITLASDTFYAGSDMTQPGLYVDSLGGAPSGFNLAALNALYISDKAWAAGFGINKCSPYEGGYSPDIGNSSTPVAILRIAGKLAASSPGSATGLQGYTYGNSPSNYSNLVAAGCEFPSVFQMTGTYPSNNAWSVLEDIYLPDPPQWLAIKAFQ